MHEVKSPEEFNRVGSPVEPVITEIDGQERTQPKPDRRPKRDYPKLVDKGKNGQLLPGEHKFRYLKPSKNGQIRSRLFDVIHMLFRFPASR